MRLQEQRTLGGRKQVKGEQQGKTVLTLPEYVQEWVNKMSEVIFKLGNVAMTLGSLRWQLKAGVNHFETAISVPDEIADKIWRKKNNMRQGLLQLQFDNKKDKLTIRGICLLLKKRVKKSKKLSKEKKGWSTIHIGDKRFFWQKLLWHGRYNELKIVNDRVLMEGIPKEALDHFTYNIKAYKQWSIRKIIMKGKKGEEQETWRPWTVVEILDLILKTIEPNSYIGIKDPRGKLNQLTPNNLNYAGQSVTQVLHNLLGYAHGNIGIDENGYMWVYPIEDDKNIKRIWSVYEHLSMLDGGVLFKTDWSQYRPRQLNVYFKKEQEIIFDYANLLADYTFQKWYDLYDVRARTFLPEPYIENVAKIPRNMTIGGKMFEAGEWVPIKFLISKKAWDIPEHKIRNGWFTDALIRWYMGTKKGIPAKLWSAYPEYLERLSTIREHYRRTFQVHAAWNEQILSIRAVTADLVDYVVGNRLPSFINTQWCKVMRLKGPASMIEKAEKAGINIDGAPFTKSHDEILNNYDKYPAAPMQIVPLQPEIGLYQLRVFQDRQHQIKTITPSKIDNIPAPYMESGGQNWKLANLNSKFRFIARLSAIFATPNTREQYEVVEKKFKNQSYPLYEIFVHKFNARYDWKRNLVNKKSIDAMASAHLERLKYELRDRWVGSAKFAGIQKWKLSGTMNSIDFEFDAKGGAYTRVNCPILPPRKDVRALIPPEVRRIIYGIPDPESVKAQ